MVTNWVAMFNDRSEMVVAVNDEATEWAQANAAESFARYEAGKPVFSVRPERCTGLSVNAHFGRYCPVHPEA